MLNGINPTIRVGGGNFSPVADAAYTCLIVDVNMVTGFNKFKGTDEDKLNYQFAILDDIAQEDGTSSRNRFLWKRCSLSLNEKSWLYKLYKGVLGRDPGKNEMEKFEAEALVGKQVKCLVNQTANADNTTIYNNILSFSKADKKLPPVDFVSKPSVVEKSSSPIDSDEVDALVNELAKE